MNSGDSNQGNPKGPKLRPPAGVERGEATSIDLGDDLLDYTASISRQPTEDRYPDREGGAPAAGDEFDAPVRLDQLEDQMESARILTREGLIDEAKRILRKILIADPHYVVARKALQEIHETELKQIFAPERRRISVRRKTQEPMPTESEAEELLRTLDRDLQLGIFDQSRSKEPESNHPILSSVEDQEEYARNLEAELKSGRGTPFSHLDRLDLGIAFLEMGLPAVALRQFRAALHSLTPDPMADPEVVLSAKALIAQALIQLGRSFEATLEIQPILRDSEVKATSKVEFLYLMGRAYETQGKDEVARKWFEQVRQIDARYRDVEERLRRRT